MNSQDTTARPGSGVVLIVININSNIVTVKIEGNAIDSIVFSYYYMKFLGSVP